MAPPWTDTPGLTLPLLETRTQRVLWPALGGVGKVAAGTGPHLALGGLTLDTHAVRRRGPDGGHVVVGWAGRLGAAGSWPPRHAPCRGVVWHASFV